MRLILSRDRKGNVMKTEQQHRDEVIDLGAAQIETRGILVIGLKDQENDGRFVNGGITADD